MGQKCPICRRIVSTDGLDAGATVVCPGCGTGIIVEQTFPEAGSPGGQSGKQTEAARSGIGSYSLKFDGSQLRKETIFGADYLGRPVAEPRQQPTVQPRSEEVVPREPARQQPDAPEPLHRQPLGSDPDSTIGFGGDEDFLFGVERREQGRPAEPPADSDFNDIFARTPDELNIPDDDLTVEPALASEDDWMTRGMGAAADTVRQGAVTESSFGDDSPFDVQSGDPQQYAATERFDQDLSAALGDDDFIGGIDDDPPSVDSPQLVDEVDYDIPPAEAAPLKGARAEKGRKGKDRSQTRRRSRAAREGSKPRKSLGPIAIVPLVIILIGSILGQTEYGYFGINLIRGDVGAARGTYSTINTKITTVGDSRTALLEHVRKLDSAYVADDSKENMVALLGALNRYRERYPDAFKSDPGLGARLNDLLAVASRKDSAAAGMTQVTELLGRGKYAEARAVLDGMMAQNAQDVDALYYYGKIALGQGKAEEAQKYFELALIKNPGFLSARYFLAESYVAQDKILEAKVILNEIAGKDAKHLPSRVLAAKIAIRESNYAEAGRLADEVIKLGMPGPDTDDLFEAHRVHARVHDVGGEKAEQLAALRAALELKPADEATAIESARLMISLNKRGELVDLLRPCRESGCISEDFLLVYAEACYLDDKIALAESAVAQGVEKYPASPRFGVLVGRQHLSQNRIRSAIASLEGAIRIDPKYTEAYELLSDALRREGKLEDAARVIVDGMAAVGEKPHLLTLLASIQIESKDISGAEASLRQAVKLDPENDEAQLRLGMAIKAQGRNDEAVAILNVLERKKALDFDGTIALADAYISVGETTRARDILEKLAADNPDRPEAANAWGRAVGLSRQFDKALDILTKVRTRFPNNGQANFYLGNVYMATSDWTNAISYYTDAVKIDGENFVWRLALARAYLEVGSVDTETEARKQLDVIAAAYISGITPVEEQDPEVYLLRGRILFGREKFALAMKDFEEALRLAPSRRDIMVDFGKSLYEMARYDDAVPYFKQVLAGDPQNPDANYFLGRIALRSGDTERATGYLTESVKRNPSRFAEAHRLLGLIYKDKGLRTLARDSFMAYIKHTKDRKSTEAVEVQRLLDKGTY